MLKNLKTKATQPSAPQRNPANGWGSHYNQTVHLRNLYSNELAQFRKKYPGHADDPKLVAQINKYDNRITYMTAHRAPAATHQPDATNGWGNTYAKTVHDRNVSSNALAAYRKTHRGQPDDPNMVARIRMYDGRIAHMNSMTPSGQMRTNMAAARGAGVAPPEWLGTLKALPGATIPGLSEGLGKVRDAAVQAGEGVKQFATGVVTGGANGFAGFGDEAMGQITGNGGYFRASNQHAKAINPTYADPDSYVQGRSPGYVADLAQSVAQNPSTLGLASIVGAGSGGWADQGAGAAGLAAGGDTQGAKKALANIPVSELHYIVSHPAQFGVNTLLVALGGRGGVLEKAGAMEDEAMALSKKGNAADTARSAQLMSQAAKLRDMVSVKVPRGAQGLVDKATRGFERSPVVRQTGAAAYALNRFGNPFKAVTDARQGTMPWGAGRGQMVLQVPRNARPEDMVQTEDCVIEGNEARRAGALSPTGRVSTGGQLRDDASAAARAERARAAKAGTPYPRGMDVGHVVDTTLSGKAKPYAWRAQTPKSQSELGITGGSISARLPDHRVSLTSTRDALAGDTTASRFA